MKAKWIIACLLLNWMSRGGSVNVEGVEVWATSSNQTIIGDANIILTSQGNALTVHIVPEPNTSGTVEISFWANNGVSTTKLVPQSLSLLGPRLWIKSLN